jgi:hypothetical protein
MLFVVAVASVAPGALWMHDMHGSHGTLTPNDAITAFVLMIAAFCFFPFWIFLRAKTRQRTLTVAELGIHTEIGRIKADYPWNKLKEVKDAGPYLLMVSWTGNAFFIPSRAFTDSAERNKFIAEVARYRGTN